MMKKNVKPFLLDKKFVADVKKHVFSNEKIWKS